MKRKHHVLLYFLEFGVLCLGFAFLLTVNLNFFRQIITLSVILTSYVLIGLLHHGTHHDITVKVVLEYILISALLLALFVFLNITRI